MNNKDLTQSAMKNSSAIQNQNQKKKDETDVVNIRVSSAASSSCFRSTHYTMNSSGTRFFNGSNINNTNNLISNLNATNNNASNTSNLNLNNTEQVVNFHPIREIKSSYSTLRPRYDYTNLVIEKNNFNSKQKELAEKRNQEEIKEMLNEWGISRAQYVEEIEKKNETKNLLKFYQKNLNLNLNKKLNSDVGFINSLNSDTMQNISPKKQLKSPKKTESSIPNQIFLQNPDKNKNIIDINGILINERIPSSDNNYFNSNSITNEENLHEGGEEIKEEFHEENKSKKKELPRNIATNIKNFDPNIKKIIKSQEEKKFEIKFKEDPNSDKAKDIIKQMRSTLEKIPTSQVILMKANDKVFEARHKYGNLLDVKEIDNYKDSYKYHMTPLSIYDNLNIDNFNNNKLAEEETNKEHKRPSTGYEFLRSRYNNNPNRENLLSQRKILTDFNSDNAFRSSEKVRNLSYNYERVKSAFNPPVDDKVYPKYFLPTPGFGLVKKAPDPNAKKRRKKGGKSAKGGKKKKK